MEKHEVKATGECAQHHNYSFLCESLANFLRQWVGNQWSCPLFFLVYFSVEHPSIPKLTTLYLFLNVKSSCVASCAPHGSVSFAAVLIQTEGMVHGHKSEVPLLEAACLQHGSGMQQIVGSIWAPSCSPWPHSDKKQTNQQNKCATETDHMLELGEQ